LLRLRDHLQPHEEAISPDRSLQDALDTMIRVGMRHVFLIEDGRPVGVITERDVVGHYAAGADPGTAAGALGRRDVVQADESRPVRFALGLMVDHGIRRVAVVDEHGRWRGSVTHENLLFAFEAELAPPAMTVRELATDANEALQFGSMAPLSAALDLMRAENRGSILLVDDGAVKGILTEADVLRLAQANVPRDRPLVEVAHRPVRAVGPEQSLRDLIAFMREGHLRHAVTVLGSGTLHVISSRDVLNNITGHYGAFLELRLRDLRATLDDLDTPVVEIARLPDADVVSWRNRAAEKALAVGIDASADGLFGPDAWRTLLGELDRHDHGELAALERAGRTWKVVCSERRLGRANLVKAVFTDISDISRMATKLRAQAAEALARTAEANTLFGLMFDHAPNGMALVAPDGTILLTNAVGARLHGRPADALIGRKLPEFIAEADRALAATHWQRLWADDGGGPIDAEFRLLLPDGRHQWVHAQANRAATPDRDDAFAICTITDTEEAHAAADRLEQARAQAARLADSLARSEARARAILNQAAVGIATLDARGRVLDPNPRVVEMFGRTRDTFVGMAAYDVMHPEDVDAARAEHAALRSGERGTVTTTRRFLRADGSIFWGDIAINPIQGPDGEIEGLVAVIQDVTRRKEAAARSRELAALLDQTVNEVHVIDPDTHRLVWANRAACEALGYDLETLTTLSPTDFVTMPADRVRAHLDAVAQAAPGEAHVAQTSHRRADGTTYPVYAHLSRVEFHGRPHILSTVVDATVEMQAQEALLRQNLHFESAQRVGGVGSWEFRAGTDELHWSAELFRILGRDAGTFVPDRAAFVGLFTPDDQPRIEAMFASVLAGEPAADLQVRAVVDGAPRDLRIHAEPIPGPGGRPSGIIGSCLDITRLATIERALRDQTQWLEEGQRIAQVGSWLYEVQTDELRFSKQTYRLYGLDPEHNGPTNSGFFDLLSPEEQLHVSAEMARAAESEDGTIDFRHTMTVHGEVRVFHQLGSIVRDADGTPMRHIGTVNDITDMVRATEEIDRQRRHLENAQRVGEIGSWEWYPATGERHWSPQTRAIYGIGPDDPVPSPQDHVAGAHPDDRPALEAAIQACLGHGTLQQLEYRHQVHGQWRIVREAAQMVTLPDGSRRMVGTVQDITERREAERALRDRTMHLEQAQRLAHVGSWEWDLGSGTLKWSDETFRIFDRDPAAGPPDLEAFRESVHPNDRTTVDQAIQAALDGPGPYDVVHRILAAGQIRVVHEHGELSRDAHGRPVRMLGTAHDITAHKRAEDRLNRSLMDTIQTLSKAFAKRDPYTASHQLRVADLCMAVGRRMGLTGQELQGLRLGAQVHDIGKISVPAEILALPRRLHPLEYQLIQTHSAHGWEILKDVDLPWPLADMIHMHHERIDGTGYPRGLKGDEIPPLVRILSVADVVEAMASHRPYRAGKGTEAALAEIMRGRGTRYDADVADHMIALFREDGYTLPPQ
jgi:PAS domain S-box-containing protein